MATKNYNDLYKDEQNNLFFYYENEPALKVALQPVSFPAADLFKYETYSTLKTESVPAISKAEILNLESDISQINSSTGKVFTGTNRKNTLKGTSGADTLQGLGGDDTYIVNHIGDAVIEKENEGDNDVVKSSIASYKLPNHVERLYLIGDKAFDGEGNDQANIIIGNKNANRLTGGGGDDFLDGKEGGDTMIGGLGNDIYSQ